MEETKPEVEANGTEELTSDYANNTFLQPTIWDLKVLFGELTAQGKGIEWHTAITIPWAQAKLFSYYLQLNIESYEM